MRSTEMSISKRKNELDVARGVELKALILADSDSGVGGECRSVIDRHFNV